MNTFKIIKALKSNLTTKMIQTCTFGTFGISVRRNRRSRLNAFGKKKKSFAVVALIGFFFIALLCRRTEILHFILLKLIKTKNVNKASACADATVTYL